MPDDIRINDLIDFAVDQKPVEFQQTFNDIMFDRIAQAVDNKKIEVAKAMFNEPTEPEEEPAAEEPTEDGEDA